MKKIVIATTKTWNIENAKRFQKKHRNTIIITKPEGLTVRRVTKYNPDYIFFPHWSWKIPKDIYTRYTCVIFHIGDLPFGRGGSPLQNLIVRGIKRTKISALKAVEDIDAGPIYMKKNLNLNSTAEAIYKRTSRVIFTDMIPRILKNNITPQPQRGKTVVFKRRRPAQSNIEKLESLDKIYDYIRMLDAAGYPPAFIAKRNLKLEFQKARIKNKKLFAQVEIKVSNEK